MMTLLNNWKLTVPLFVWEVTIAYVGGVTGSVLNKFHRCFLQALQADVLIERTDKSWRLQYKT